VPLLWLLLLERRQLPILQLEFILQSADLLLVRLFDLSMCHFELIDGLSNLLHLSGLLGELEIVLVLVESEV
jgi:hypothetical protein